MTGRILRARTAALVDYQQARLELMLDIGALDSDQPRFWLKDQLAGLVPPGTVIAKRPVSSDEEVPPPNQFFEN